MLFWFFAYIWAIKPLKENYDDYVKRTKSKELTLQNDGYSRDAYVEKALRFIEFFKLLSDSCQPKLIVTDEYIGAMVLDFQLETSANAYNQNTSDTEAWSNMQKRLSQLCTSSRGYELYRKLGLMVKIRNSSSVYPVIYMWLPCHDLGERQKAIKAIQRKYLLDHGKRLEIGSLVHW